ncbi:MAG: nucleoside hydrolase [Kiritimatiellales bacterium]|nr:nucleoside hydrolase [Kiritimatiellales bacterium]
MSRPNIIFDTDMGNDVDDVLAQVLLHSFVQDGAADFDVALVNKGSLLAPAFTDLINRFCGRTDIEVGFCPNGPTPEEGLFLRPVLEESEGLLPYDPDTKKWPDAVSLLRRHLASIPDRSGVYVSIGFCTILSRFLESGPDEYSTLTGVELATRKLRFVSLMAGNFDAQVMQNPTPENAEHNIVKDIPSAVQAITLCPVPMVFSGFEVGVECCFPRRVVREEMNWCKFNPLKMAYGLYLGMEHDRPLWDLTSLLHAVFPDEGHFDVSEPGTVTVSDSGHTMFHPDASGLHRYLILKDERLPEIIDLFSKGCSRRFDSAFEPALAAECRSAEELATERCMAGFKEPNYV